MAAVAPAQRTVTVRQLREDEEARWDSFVANAPNGHLLQSWGWGELKRRSGWQPVRLVVEDDGRVLAGAQVLIRSRFGISLAYMPRGPVAPADQPELYARLLDAVHKVARSRHAIFMKVEPNEPAGAHVERVLTDHGFRQSPGSMQFLATIMIDLSGGPEAVLAAMKSKTRQNIRLSEKRGVTVRPASGEEDMHRFQELMEETGRRAGFPVRSLDYHRDLLEEFRKRDQAELLLAEAEGQVIAGLMVFAFGRGGIELYGSSDTEQRRDKPNYLLRWKALEWCMARGCAYYDFGGILEQAAESPDGSPPQGEDGSGLWGVYEFKRRFGGSPFRFAGAYDYPYIRPLYLLLTRRLRGAMSNRSAPTTEPPQPTHRSESVPG